MNTKQIFSQNYYVSSSATSNGNGSFNLPWNSFDDLNSLLSTNSLIDTIFLKCGDVFRGQITISSPSNFVITSYGAGNRPIISGADQVGSWVQNGTIWESNFTPMIKNFFVNDKEQIVAQYPDFGQPFLTVDNATLNNLTDNALNSFSSSILDSSQICVHTAQWCWEKSPILSSSGNTITYENPTLREPTANYAYFLYDHLSFLTVEKEWKYDIPSQKIYFIPEGGNPNSLNCEASVRDYGILFMNGISNVEIINIAFEKQYEAGVGIIDASNENIRIDNCHFARQYKYGVDQQGKDVEIKNSYFREVDGLAVFLNGNAKKTEVHHNIFRNNGGFRNSGIGMEINLSAIKGAYVDSCHIHHNDIDSAGYCGISMDGRWNLIERNIVKNAMLLNNDGAALKSFGIGSQYNIFRNNFVSDSEGNPAGTPNGSFITPAIYFDFSTNHCTIENNTVFNHNKKGIFLNASTNNNTVVGNVVYGGNFLLDFNGAPNPNISPYIPMTGMTVKNNQLFAKDPDAYILRMVDNTGGYNHGEIDSNYYFQPYNQANNTFFPSLPSQNFSEWQSNSGYDANSKNSFVSWTLPDLFDTLFMNQTDNVVNIDLGTSKYLNLDSVVICGNLTLQPYSSAILINTGEICESNGIGDSKQMNKLQIIPNPTSDIVNILLGEKKIDKIEIYATNGQKVMETTKNKFSGSHLENGIYFISVFTNDGILNSKFIKE